MRRSQGNFETKEKEGVFLKIKVNSLILSGRPSKMKAEKHSLNFVMRESWFFPVVEGLMEEVDVKNSWWGTMLVGKRWM